jgi:DNA-binding NarL/FixJ family response regulator
MTPRILLADDHAESRRLLRSLLELEFDVVGEAADGDALVAAAWQLLPDVIVTDISMPGVDGIAAAARILQWNPTARIVFVTAYGDSELVERSLADGGMGYVLKRSAGDDLLPAVHAALAGKIYISEAMSACHVQARR